MANTEASFVKSGAVDAPLPGAFELFKPSWQALKLNLTTFIELIAIPVLIKILALTLADRAPSSSMLLNVLGGIAGLLFAPALTLTQLKSVRGQAIDFSSAVQEGLKYFWRFLGLTICMGVIILIGFLLLIVPGFIMLRRYILAPFYLIDRDLTIKAALSQSATESKQFSRAIWAMLGVEVLFALLSIFIVGIFLSVMFYCAPALRYDQIKQASKKLKPKTA